ncbi:MAG: iron ABC transporter permease [Armatimonadetes bacterium]|nr:iron ABC transporter permease [Armatimonadota bacterium]MDE2205411.1 iron ABC transporter permease [Armatimonadota bacterium]
MLLGTSVLLDVGMGDPAAARLITPVVVLQTVARHLPFVGAAVPRLHGSTAAADAIVWQLRMPRALGGALVGALLAMAGVAFQSLLRNPLADPYMVGVSSGSAVGSMVVILLGGTGLFAGLAQPVAAFAAGIAAMMLVYRFASVGGRIAVHSFLLAGVVVGTFLWSFVPLMVTLAQRAGDSGRGADVMSQLFGSLQFVDWRVVAILAPIGILGGLALYASARELNLLAVGEEAALHLGVNVERLKRRIAVAGAVCTAAAVSAAGIIAFVGLVVPHICRKISGPDHRRLIPLSAVGGATMLVLADWLSRVFLHELQIGVITSFVGAPLFCVLLKRGERSPL